MEEEKKPYGTVLLKAAKIIDHLSNSKEAQSLAAIAANTSLSSPTALKILDTLLLIGYVEKDEQTKRFTLGSALIRHANNRLAKLDIIKITDPYLRNLQAGLDETVHLGILDKMRSSTSTSWRHRKRSRTSIPGSATPTISTVRPWARRCWLCSVKRSWRPIWGESN